MRQVFVGAHEQEHEQKWSPESCHKNSTVGQEGLSLQLPQPPAIKQEVPDPWSSPERQELPDVEGSDTCTLTVTPTCIKSCSHSDVAELQSCDTGNEDRKPVPDTSTNHRNFEGNSVPGSECQPLLPDCYVSLNSMGPELGLGVLTSHSISEVHTQSHTERNSWTKSCEPASPTPPNKETKQKGKYRCHVCGKKFSHNVHLATHSRIHMGEKLFMCKVCGKEFRSSNTLRGHMSTHSEEKPHRCLVCGQAFRHVGNLNVHRRIHTGEKPYGCTVCGKKFSRKNLMTGHMVTHG